MSSSSRKRIFSGENLESASPEPPSGEIKQRFSEKTPGYTHDSQTREDESRSQTGKSDYVDPRMSCRLPRKPANELLLTIKLHNSWGTTKSTGLQRIEFLDKDGRTVSVPQGTLSCKNCGLLAPKNIDRLLAPAYSDDPGWDCVIQFAPGEIYLDLKQFNQISSLRIHNLKPTNSHNVSSYNGVRKITVSFQGKEIYSGELDRPLSELQPPNPTLILLPDNSLRVSQRAEPPSYLQRVAEPRTQKVFSKTHNFSSNKNQASGSLPTDNTIISPRQSESCKPQFTQASEVFKIVPNYNLSDEELVRQDERYSHNGKPDDKDRESSGEVKRGNNYSIDSSDQRGTMEQGVGGNQGERSSSKASRSSHDSKIRNHPRMANSTTKLIFDTTKNPIPARLKVNPTPSEKAIYIDDKIAPMQTDWSKIRESSSETLKPLRADKTRLPFPRHQKDQLKQQFMSVVEANPTFCLPNLPLGRVINLRIYSNWGDTEHVGFQRIEFFDGEGKQIVFERPAERIEWIPPSQGTTRAIHNDSEFLQQLIATSPGFASGEAQWMTALLESSPFELKIRMNSQNYLSMIRIWNYSKSRTHASRGIRHITLHLDGRLIFFGEIAKSSGDPSLLYEDAEYLSFTNNKSIIQNIDSLDWVSTATIVESTERGKSNDRVSLRPQTGDKDGSPKQGKERVSAPMLDLHLIPMAPHALHEVQRRPGPKTTTLSVLEYSLKSNYQVSDSQRQGMMKRSTSDSHVNADQEITAESIEFKFQSTWNGKDSFFIRAIEVYGR